MICVKCNSDKQNANGQCSNCKNQRQKEHARTPQGKASMMWRNLKRRANNSDGKSPTYESIPVLMDRESFINWAVLQLEKWIESQPIEQASVDRKDNTKPYELANIQLLDKKENLLKKSYNKNVYAPEGFAWCGKCKDYQPVTEFWKNKSNYNGLTDNCKFHHQQRLGRVYKGNI